MKNIITSLIKWIILLAAIAAFASGVDYLLRHKFPTEPDYGSKILKADTVFVERIREVPKYITVTKLKAKTDTLKLYVDKEGNIVKDIAALKDSTKLNELEEMFAEVSVADTVLPKDSSKISVKYYHKPLNYFTIEADIKEKIIEREKRIREYTPIKVPVSTPFYKDYWFYSTLGVVAILIFGVK